jgi:putative sigma-54 modulation protein
MKRCPEANLKKEMMMQTDIQSRGFTLTDAIQNYTVRRLRYAVSFASEYIQRVTVRLSDINGPRGGADKRCHLVVTLENMPSVVIEDTESDLYVAIDRATERASRSVARHLERKHTYRVGIPANQGITSDMDDAPNSVN